MKKFFSILITFAVMLTFGALAAFSCDLQTAIFAGTTLAAAPTLPTQKIVFLQSLKEEYKSIDTWLNAVEDLSSFVEDGQTLVFPEAGAAPVVYKNKTSDIDAVEPEETVHKEELDVYDSQNYKLRNVYLHALPYDKIQHYTKKSANSIIEKELADAYYNFAPESAGAKKIILPATGAVVKEEVIIEPYYDGILIAGSGVNSGNANAIDDNNFPNLELQSGTITYAHDTKTFTLNSVNANVFSECLIYITDGAENADYKINLIGNSVINVEGHNAIWTFRNLTIQGNGSLELVSNTSCGIYVNNSTLNIKNTKVEAKGNWGIAGVNGSSGEILIIDNSTVKATGSNGSICLFQSITHPNCKIIQPEGAAVANNGSNGQAVMLNGSVVKSEVVIVPFYGIQIAGTKLNSVNAGNINNTNFPNLGLTEGTITYDHIGKTFTLTDVIATVTSGMFIEILNTAEDADYKINLIGNSVITVESHGIWTSRNLAVEGNGSLEIVSSGVGFFVDDNSTLYIKNTKVEVKGVFGIKGVNGTMGEILIIENSTVKATGSSGSICDLQSITHPECKIIQPEGAAVANNGSDGQAVMLNGSLVKSEVILTPNSGVNDVDAETAFSIYPNPANNLINIITENANELITISDLSGKVVYSEQASKKQNSIDISQLSVGMYIVRIGEKATKFVKE
ncbi:MAG: T9SS type A sorting domain-containing protein [Bacteroidales bacterium]|nr:T9SS type A sorting domain-containing protein [Bacteroidales bacterium]